MLRPMLKEWLDIKLPEIVEAMVAQEIARISGRKL
jgi:cell pole-organizing protein PopZ